MISFLNSSLIEFGVNGTVSYYLSYFAVVVFILLLSFLVNFIAGKIFLKILRILIKKTKYTWDNTFLDEGVFDRLSHLAPAIVVFAFSGVFSPYDELIRRFALVYMIVIGILTITSLLSAAEDIYSSYKVSKQKPIKGYIQVVKIFIFVIGTIIVLGTVMNRSPWSLLTGIGAMTAVLVLVFKDPIMGLIASIQLAANDMVSIGDWIEVTKFGADGEVVEISLSSIKVKNWDKTITTIPTYSLISDSFKNWRGMSESGGRRIKRAIHIDLSSIRFCDDEMLEKFGKIKLISDYMKDKRQDIEDYTREQKTDISLSANERRLTNIGTFRVYILNYLKNHPKIHDNMTLIVRQMPPCENGLPIEIYAFSNDIEWANYENVQSDIFDHILALVPEFSLRVFQYPTGDDLKRFQKLNKSQ